MEKVRHRCGQTVLAGLSNVGRAAAVHVVLDREELDPAGELAAILDGRRTWTLHHGQDAWLRGPWRIRAWPAASGWRQAVHRDHRCGQEDT